MKILKILFSLFLIASVVVVVGGIFWYRVLTQQILPITESTVVVIPKGSSLPRIAELLHDKGVIKRSSDFVILARLQDHATKLQAGRYQFQAGLTLSKLVRMISEGDTYEETITIPEGLNRFEIAHLLREKTHLDSARIIELTEDAALCQSLQIQAVTLEGYLFPDTYRLEWEVDEEVLLRRMVEHFHQQLTPVDLEQAAQLGLSLHDVVTLSSIIEKETGAPAERPIISGVFHNRLRKGWRLESDPTVLYALGEHKRRVLYKDLLVDSPYNTYRYAGLPPGPICNPGQASLLAAIYPEEVEFLYFVAKGDGTHIFSQTNREHISAKRKVKQMQERQD